MMRLVVILVCSLQAIAAIQIYSHLPLHSETYVRHLSGRIRRSVNAGYRKPPHTSDFAGTKSRQVFGRKQSSVSSNSGNTLKDILLDKISSETTAMGQDVRVIVPPGVRVINAGRNDQQHANPGFVFPEKMRFAFTVNGKNIVLNLKLNKKQMTHTPAEVVENGHLVPYHIDTKRDYAYYQMLHGGLGAAVKVRCENYQLPCYIVGRFTFEGEEYAIEAKNHRAKLLNKYILHNIHKEPSNGNDDNTDDTLVSFLDDDTASGVHDGGGGEGNRTKRAAQITYEVELLMVTDCWIYKYWLGRLGDANAAVKQIRVYYEQVGNSMDMRYSTATTPAMVIRIVPVEIIIIKDCVDSPWSNVQGDVLSASTALSQFQTWVNGQTFRTPYDACQTYTRKDLASSTRSTTGLARMFWKKATPTAPSKTVSILCRSQTMALSIVEDRLSSGVERTATHELAHNMGVMHDGTYSCSDTDKYIMSRSSSPGVSASIAANPWTFSSCSRTELQRTLSSVYYDGSLTRCLSEQSSFNAAEYRALLASPRLRELFTLDEQCALRRGVGSVDCTRYRSYPIKDICHTGLTCSPTNGACSSYSRIRAFSGSFCGYGKWCHLGKCVTKPTDTTTVATVTTPPTTTTNSPDTTTAKTSYCDILAASYEANYEAIYTCWDVTCVGTCTGRIASINCAGWVVRPQCA